MREAGGGRSEAAAGRRQAGRGSQVVVAKIMTSVDIIV